MTCQFAAKNWRENNWIVAQCVDIDVASQGHTEEESLANLNNALILNASAPKATMMPILRTLEVEFVT